MKVIQEWLGHSVYRTTANLYSHLEQKAKEGAATAIADKPAAVGTTVSAGEEDGTEKMCLPVAG
jgi:hypothetical protein